MKNKTKKIKVRNEIAQAHSKRGAAGSGFHTKRKYERTPKHKRVDNDA